MQLKAKLAICVFILTITYFSACSAFSNIAMMINKGSENMKVNLYPGEVIKHIDGYPSLTKFTSGSKNKPLIVFIPGNSHLARISYGFPGGNKKDFLSYWFHEKGYPFLAISYPLENQVFKRNYPNYTIKDWSRSVIDIVREVINKNNLSNNIIIVAWSMGGELAQVVNVYSQENNIKIKLFVGLSAPAPLYTLLPKGTFFEKLKPTDEGLANTQPFSNFFLNMLSHQNKINKHTIIPDKVYLSQFIGNCPIDIMGTALRYKDGKFTYDLLGAINDTGAVNINNYPPIAVIHGSDSKDLHFAVFGKYDWGSIIMRHYYKILESCARNNQVILNKGLNIIKKAPNKLVTKVDGTHFFFVGERGARHTVNEVIKLIQVNNNLTKMIMKVCVK